MAYVIAVVTFLAAIGVTTVWILLKLADAGLQEGRTDTVTANRINETMYHKKPIALLDRTGKRKYDYIYGWYTYEVEGKSYTKKVIVLHRIKHLPASTEVIYQRNNPKNAYFPEFEKRTETDCSFIAFIAIILYAAGLFCVLYA